MDKKIKLFWVSASEARHFVEKVEHMYKEIKEGNNEGKKG
ncbi:MAG: hypothetical protein A4E62_02197 [Syntrophorhabdus sp. PtaU1.Bin002]|nr:MAG: hypothetical protein A4E62_02197 [Syntrophorhabdus sp. PtaU1.Bin002]